MRRIRSGCCAPAARGYVAALPSPTMNSRRRISDLPRLDRHHIAVGAACLALTPNRFCSAGGRLWPKAAVNGIRLERQLSGISCRHWGRRTTAEDDPFRTQRPFGRRTRGDAARPASLPANDAATSRTHARKRSTTGLSVRFFSVTTTLETPGKSTRSAVIA
jgi:hypothetical protein